MSSSDLVSDAMHHFGVTFFSNDSLPPHAEKTLEYPARRPVATPAAHANQ